MRRLRESLRISSFVGILFCSSCGQPNSQNTNVAVKQAMAAEKKFREEAAIEVELSNLAEQHKAIRNWLSFAEKTGIESHTFTLEYQDALTQLNGQSIVVVGYVADVRRMGDHFRILCVCCVEPSRQAKADFLQMTFELEANAESTHYVLEMTKKHHEDTDAFPAGFAFVISPTRLRVTHDRDVSAEGSHEDEITSAEVVEGNLYPHFTILGRCRGVRYLKGFLPL